ncbi:hypothetical protein CTI12_AA132760 [Artemisia annua]|uniref:Uncharacterized protein n=1 Tax=Artemisia annua TaxID=35608 RepID=A0A2U1PPA4_ARTAN|nr:hypothetical protein CTI12_AA132760 [Artemisia annua]
MNLNIFRSKIIICEGEVSGEGPHVALEATPIRGHPEPRAQSPDAEQLVTKSSDSVRITRVVDAPEQDSRGSKRKEPAGGYDGASTSRRRRRVIRDEESSSEVAGGDESHTAVEKDVAEASSPNVEDADDTTAHMERSLW